MTIIQLFLQKYQVFNWSEIRLFFVNWFFWFSSLWSTDSYDSFKEIRFNCTYYVGVLSNIESVPAEDSLVNCQIKYQSILVPFVLLILNHEFMLIELVYPIDWIDIHFYCLLGLLNTGYFSGTSILWGNHVVEKRRWESWGRGLKGPQPHD